MHTGHSGRGERPRVKPSVKPNEEEINRSLSRYNPQCLQETKGVSGGPGWRTARHAELRALAWSASEVDSMLMSSRSAVRRHICSQPIRRRRSSSKRITPRRRGNHEHHNDWTEATRASLNSTLNNVLPQCVSF